jgi:UDP-N-acetylmuramate dehydrogenase
MQVQENIPLKDHTTFRLGGTGDFFTEVTSKEELLSAIAFSQEKSIPLFILGEGSNTIFSDGGFHGLVVRIKIMGSAVEKEEGDYAFVRVCAGENFDDFVMYTLTHRLYGLENLSHIPGTVGAAPVQNIGAYGVEVEKAIQEVECYDSVTGEFVTLSHDDCHFSYRNSVFKQDPRYIIISVLFKLSKTFSPVIVYKDLQQKLEGQTVTPEHIREIIIATRNEKLPNWKILPTAGSFFKNPQVTQEKADELCKTYPELPVFKSDGGVKVSAGYLIDHVANMKGANRGDVGVYQKHALVLVNYGKGTFVDLQLLVKEIQEKVKEKTGLTLEPEVNVVM